MTGSNLDDKQINSIIEETPLKRLVGLDQLTQIILNFASGQMAGMTGQEILVDGGWGVSKLVSYIN